MENVIKFPQKPGWEKTLEKAIEDSFQGQSVSIKKAAFQVVKDAISPYVFRPAKFVCEVPDSLEQKYKDSIQNAFSEIHDYYKDAFGDLIAEMVKSKVELFKTENQIP